VDALQVVRFVDTGESMDGSGTGQAAPGGNVETIRTTASHPFYVDGRGWVEAGDLRAGEKALTPEGRYVTVISSVSEPVPGGLTVYNLEVDGDHTYFVEDGHGAQSPVWVHNGTSCTSGENAFAATGRAIHAELKMVGKAAGWFTEFTLNTGRRIDAWRFLRDPRTRRVIGAVIAELKPNNARGIARGTRQLAQYAADLRGQFSVLKRLPIIQSILTY
jgi:hypothetical protein